MNNLSFDLFENTNPKGDYAAHSRSLRLHGKASRRRCSHSTASLDNAVHASAGFGLSLYINGLGTSRMTQLCVAALDKGAPFPASRALICIILDVLCVA